MSSLKGCLCVCLYMPLMHTDNQKPCMYMGKLVSLIHYVSLSMHCTLTHIHADENNLIIGK